MPLAAPTGLTISRLRRINTGATMDFYGDISWVNTEAANHFVELTLTPGVAGGLGGIPSTFGLARGAAEIKRVALSQFFAAESINSKTVTVSITLKSSSESSTTATVTQTLSLQTATTLAGGLSYNAITGQILLPEWTGVAEVREEVSYVPGNSSGMAFANNANVWGWGVLNFSGLGVTTVRSPLPALLSTDTISIDERSSGLDFVFDRLSAAFTPTLLLATYGSLVLGETSLFQPIRRIVREGTFFWRGQLFDGGFYSATATFRIAKNPQRSGGVWTDTTSTLTQSIAFEYYSRGIPPVQTPVITSAAAVSALASVPFSYQIEAANNPTSFGATSLPAGLSVNSSTGLISGATAAGAFTPTISATNSAGTGTATLTITAAAPVPVFTSPLSAETFVDVPVDLGITTDDSRAVIAVNFGSATGLTYNAAARRIVGNVAAADTYNLGLTATNSFGTANENLSLLVRPFTAFGGSISAVRNSRVRQPLSASHRATWSIGSGVPDGFGIEYFPAVFGTATGPESAFLVGTPLVAGSFGVQLTATRSGTSQTSSSTLTLAVTDAPLPATVISGNTDLIRNGLTVERGSNISLAFTSSPAPASWEAGGMPPGLVHDNGVITGAPTANGTYSIALSAQADGFSRGSIGLRIVVIDPRTPPPPPPPPTGTTPQTRSPWLLQQWELTDLHILTRSRVVQSTLFESGALRVKLGDALNFAVFFVDQNNAVFALAPSQLRLTIRRADNLDDLIIFKAGNPPASATEQGQTYYLMPVTTGNREREVALEWVEDSGKNDPLPCVADLDWSYDGKLYSSRTFPVLLELDVTRP